MNEKNMPRPPLINPDKTKIDQAIAGLGQHQGAIDMLMLRTLQQQQILDQYRVAIYNLELRFALLIKMIEEKGVMAKGEFDTRWPVYLKNDVGVIEPDGRMAGTLKVIFYG
jgi:hypothetical protein